MGEATGQLVIIGLPKCGNVFFRKAMQATLGCEDMVLCTRANMQQQIIPERLIEFAASPRAVGGQHLPPTVYNLRLLEAVGVRRIALLFRDPRDALISWWHHLERPDIKAPPWAPVALYAAGLQSRNYYELSLNDKLSDLIEHMYPAMQRWMAAWVEVMDNVSPFQFHVNAYEKFAPDPAQSVRRMLEFFGHDCSPILPSIGAKDASGIDPQTHHRRGQIGSYRDETPPELIGRLDQHLDRPLAARLGWPI